MEYLLNASALTLLLLDAEESIEDDSRDDSYALPLCD